MPIDILVPTYNCGLWIDEFITSLINQNYSDWRIITRDDGSSDNTLERMITWSQRLGERMIIIANHDNANYGPVSNYNILMNASTAPWVMLADPDDIWKSTKISLILHAMHDVEKRAPNTPVVIFTDAEVVDERGKLLMPSYWKWLRLKPELAMGFHRMIVENAAISSTMMVNRAALNMALPIIGSWSFQDWWLALVACAFGKVVPLKEKTILYRRHSANDSQAPLTESFIGMARNLFFAPKKVNKLLQDMAKQAAAFLMRFREHLNAHDIAMLEAVATLPTRNAFGRRWTIIKYDLWFASIYKNIGWMILL